MVLQQKNSHRLWQPKYWLLWLLIALLWLIARLPLRWAMKFGAALGTLARWLMSSRVKVVLTNLRLCFPDKTDAEREVIMRQTFVNFGRGIIVAAIAWWSSKRRIERLTVAIEGLSVLQQCYQQKRGVILFLPHLFTIEICGRIVADKIPLDAVYQPQTSHFFDQLIKQARENHYHRLINRDILKQLLYALKQREIIIYLPDQDFGRSNSVFAPFFGVATATAKATLRLVKPDDVELVFMSCSYSEKDNGFVVKISQPLTPFPTGDAVADATTINQYIEQIVLQDISNYMWLHKRFKTRPEGEANVY